MVGLDAVLGGGGVTASSSASSGPVSFGGAGPSIGGINTGSQGLDVKMVAVIGLAVVLALAFLRR